MEVSDFLDELRAYRARVPCSTSEPNYNYKQGHYDDSGKFRYDRYYTAELILYPDNDRHWEVLNMIINRGYMAAFIIHDCDLLDDSVKDDDIEYSIDDELPVVSSSDGIHKRLHVHCVLWFANARTNTAVAKSLNFDSYLTVMYNSLDSRIRYLVHKDNVEKYQYSPSRVCGPLSERLPQLLAEYGRRPSDLLRDVVFMIKSIDARKIIKFADFSFDLLKNGYDTVLMQKYMGLIRECVYEHNSTARWLNEQDKTPGEVPFVDL